MAATFTRMDESTAEDWAQIGAATSENQSRVADQILGLLASLEHIEDGFICDQLTHALQTATMAEADEAPDEVIFAALCHDIGKAISVPNHASISAEIIKPYVDDDVYQAILHHQDFQGRHYYHHFGGDRNMREVHSDASWFALCEQIVDDWDQMAFDPERETLPLAHFEPLVRRVTAQAKMF